MSESRQIQNHIKSIPGSGLKPFEGEKMPGFETRLDSNYKISTAASEILSQISPKSYIIPVFIAGTGAIGSTLIKQIQNLDNKYKIIIIGACNKRHCIWDINGIAPEDLYKRLNKSPKTNWDYILEQFYKAPKPLIFVDATGSAEVARLYPLIIKADIHIATPSKRANTFEQSFFDELQNLSKARHVEFNYEPTVGAGLPIISTIKNLLETGDTIIEISGSLSGTMNYLFTELERGVPFSKAVIKARKLGYAEPDPRDDLSGEDVARKFLTLARTVGLKIERSELKVETLVPQKLISVDQKTFLNELSEIDDYWKSKIEYAKKNSKTLRYIGKLTQYGISVGIQSIPIDSPLGQLRGTDNLFQISTHRYSDSPIVIQGPGAGKEVTAAGVLADVLKIARKINSQNV